jgi:type VI protein secretion system component Hcp
MAASAEQMTLKITGATGGATDPKWSGTFPLEKVEWSMQGSTNLHTLNYNKDNCYSRVSVGDVFVAMKQSSGSPNLMSIFSKRQAWTSATITVKTTGAEAITYALTTVSVKSYRSVASGSGIPMEEVLLHFADMSVSYSGGSGSAQFQISGHTQDGKPG